MKLQLSATKMVYVLAFTALAIGFSAFSQKDKPGKYSFRKDADTTDDDTFASGKHDRYLTDKDMEKLDAAMKRLDEQMEKLDERIKKIDFSKIEKDMNDAMNKIDFDKINQKIESSLKHIDFEKMNRELKKDIAKIDKEKMKAHMEKAMMQVDKQLQFQKLHEGNEESH